MIEPPDLARRRALSERLEAWRREEREDPERAEGSMAGYLRLIEAIQGVHRSSHHLGHRRPPSVRSS